MEDPSDGSCYRKFWPYGYGKQLRPNALCPGTLSLERHRLLWIYLTRNTKLLQQPQKVLHVAPEQVFYKKFKALPHWDYTTTDLNSPLADIQADLRALPFESEQFDVVFCNHVLEHIPEDHKALKEKCLNSSLKNTKVWKRNVIFSSVREQTLKAPTHHLKQNSILN